MIKEIIGETIESIATSANGSQAGSESVIGENVNEIKPSLDTRTGRVSNPNILLVASLVNGTPIWLNPASTESLQREIQRKNKEIERLNSINKGLLEKVKRQDEEAANFKKNLMDLIEANNENTPVRKVGKGKENHKKM